MKNKKEDILFNIVGFLHDYKRGILRANTETKKFRLISRSSVVLYEMIKDALDGKKLKTSQEVDGDVLEIKFCPHCGSELISNTYYTEKRFCCNCMCTFDATARGNEIE